mmetsp:Transcript_24971/g.63501  ORF Transcript_24971/g.63501 Transcript_24971/m.63501 type:complete len:209 (-) Transcript_24971:298-924(-)
MPRFWRPRRSAATPARGQSCAGPPPPKPRTRRRRGSFGRRARVRSSARPPPRPQAVPRPLRPAAGQTVQLQRTTMRRTLARGRGGSACSLPPAGPTARHPRRAAALLSAPRRPAPRTAPEAAGTPSRRPCPSTEAPQRPGRRPRRRRYVHRATSPVSRLCRAPRHGRHLSRRGAAHPPRADALPDPSTEPAASRGSNASGSCPRHAKP